MKITPYFLDASSSVEQFFSDTTISENLVTDLDVNHFKDFKGRRTGVIHRKFCPLLLETIRPLCAVMIYSEKCLSYLNQFFLSKNLNFSS